MTRWAGQRASGLSRLSVAAALLLAASAGLPSLAQESPPPTGDVPVRPAASAAAISPAIGAVLEATGEASRKEAARQICRMVQSEAESRRLPPGFFARLIWKESRFDPDAVSPKGAQGIAQFMPGTAADRALADPFDIPTALAESAAFLRELADAFGNLGLAAAAYNAGPGRVERWIAGRASLPWETVDYVQAITGLSAEMWREAEIELPDFTLDEALPFEDACIELAMAGRPRMPAAEAPTRWWPWGVQVAAHFTRSVALSAYSRVKSRHASLIGDEEPMVVQDRAPSRGRKQLFTVRIGADSRAAAQEICQKLRTAGGACVVMKN